MSWNEFNFLPRFEAYKPSKFLKDFYPFCSVVSFLRYLFFFAFVLPGYSPQPPPPPAHPPLRLHVFYKPS